MRKATALAVLSPLVAILTSCSSTATQNSFDADIFKADPYNLVLCFDFRDDDRPLAGLTIHGNAHQVSQKGDSKQPSIQPERPDQSISQGGHTVLLPFETSAAQGNRNLLATWGSYKDFTVINYISSPDDRETRGIGIIPVFGPQPQPLTQVEDLKDSVFMIHSGLERRFLYKYLPSDRVPEKWPSVLQGVSRDVVDAIGVVIPADAKGIEIRDNKTAIPDFETQLGNVRFYPASFEKGKARYLEIRYALETTKAQRVFTEVILKVIAAVIVPTLELLFLSFADIQKRRTWLAVLIGGIVLQVLLLTALLWMVLSVKGELEEKVIIEGASIFAGALFSGLLFYVKRKPKEAPNEHPPAGIHHE